MNRPVNYVSFFDAARFANWLTTGNTEDGVYRFSGGVLQTIMDHQIAASTYGTAYFIPTEDEWYKAAYHKNDGDTGNYFRWPTSTDSVPSKQLVEPTDPGNNATFSDMGSTIGSPYYRTEVGAHENSASPYGTFDQGGNVWEWNETAIGSSSGLMRGGSWVNTVSALFPTHPNTLQAPSYEYATVGFRVASSQVVPEPAAFLTWGGLLGMGLVGGWWRRRRRG